MTDYAQYHARSKSLLAALVIWFLVGGLGAHRFYLKSALGFAYITFQISAIAFFFGGKPEVSVVLWVIVACFVVFDFFWLISSVNKYNETLAAELAPKKPTTPQLHPSSPKLHPSGLAIKMAAPKEKVDVKACPDCAEDIKSAARKCRFCGYEFGPA